MTDQEIVDLFDTTNITMARLASISGRSVAELKQLLMGGAS
jgi:predicted HTH domain antitoxin